MRYLKTFENMSSNYEFDRCVYQADDKSIIGAYMIVAEDDKTTTLLNIKESERDMIFLDSAQSYDVSIHRIVLPKSELKVLCDVDGKEGFSIVKIPYWLYKKNQNALEIKRIKGTYDGRSYIKRIDIPFNKLMTAEFYKNFRDPNVVKYIEQTNPDKKTSEFLEYYAKGDFNW